MSCRRRVQPARASTSLASTSLASIGLGGAVLVATTLLGCGLIDELSSPDAATFCEEAWGGPAAYVRVTRTRRDDGTIAVSVAKFDAHHHPVAYLDDQSDGTVEVTSTSAWEYDEEGNIIGEAFDHDADGSVDSRSTSTQDEAGNLVLREVDSDADGVIDHVTRSTYDADGRRLSTTRSDGDGLVLSVWTWTYDEDGGSIQQVDDDGDGVIDWTETVMVSAGGSVWTTETDGDVDGEPEEISRTTYDEAGEVVEQTRDQDADGQPETTYRAVYSASGELELEVHGSHYLKDDPPVESTTTYLRDASGRLSSIETKTGETLEHLVSYSYEEERALRVSTNYGIDGQVKWRRWEERDDNGRLSREGGDEDGDGQDEWLTTAVRCTSPDDGSGAG